MKDFCVEHYDNPEIPALIGEMLGASGVNIEGLCLTTCEELSIIHFVVEDAVTTRRVLENSGIKIRDVSEVFILSRITEIDSDSMIRKRPAYFAE